MTGIECPNGDVQAYAAAIRTLASDDALRARYGAAARERVGKLFTQAQFSANVRRLISELSDNA